MITLDRIVTSLLLQKGYPIHWYLQFLKFASDCLRELQFDVIGAVKTIQLPVNEYNAVELPAGYVDYIKIGLPNGQYVQPLIQRDGITRYTQETDFNTNEKHESEYTSRGSKINANGELAGGVPGHRLKNQIDYFKVVIERNEIQLDERIDTDSIILEYITDGQDADNATKVHPYAQKTIEAYVLWQSKALGRGENSQLEKMEYDKEERKLKARMSSLTLEDIKRAILK